MFRAGSRVNRHDLSSRREKKNAAGHTQMQPCTPCEKVCRRLAALSDDLVSGVRSDGPCSRGKKVHVGVYLCRDMDRNAATQEPTP